MNSVTVLVKKAGPEPSVCPVMTKEVVSELSDCPATVKRTEIPAHPVSQRCHL